ncbi:cellulase family glycosylhydrolase [Roseimaritima sediminicola]|uniref:cellulase family glycosylhydrolase n=1 Tax=Roseimaritima sediminicola TaxID=2662066 RepID=UPI0012982E3D|nr:cellulase family glycosylhydrolase [Roseimaritima sediminicola]
MRLVLLVYYGISLASVSAADMPRVQISDDGRGFKLANSQDAFVPWGFNYDRDANGQLIEQYWDEEWPRVIEDFQEMKALGANVVRIHLQFAALMQSPTEARPRARQKLTRLLRLAEQTGLYLDLTGLGCYHKADVPAWYDALSEAERWQAQAAFWEVVAETCADSPAVFCYDLMNEPVVPGGNKPREDWLGPAFAGKHFVQFISLDRAGRKRSEVAKQWIAQLVAAIRKHDGRHLITVGLVPWSLDRPGMTSGFDPTKVAEDLDFIAVHLYPETGKVDEAIETLRGFAAAGKPVVIEETFPLKCSAEELSVFLDASREHAAGWIGFYWGQTPEELRGAETIPQALTLGWLELFQRGAPPP